MTTPEPAPPLRIMAAGSLRAALTEVIARWQASENLAAAPRFGPAGVLREKIEAGAPCDLFLSANLEHARALARRAHAAAPVTFTVNTLVAAVLPGRQLTPETLLATLTDPADPRTLWRITIKEERRPS